MSNFAVVPTVQNWTWVDDGYSKHVQLSSSGASLPPGDLTGHFALHSRLDSGGHVLRRDPLGVNKLFYAVDEEGELHTSNFAIGLRHKGIALSDIYSVPSGHSVFLNPQRREFELVRHSKLEFAAGDLSNHSIARDVRQALDDTFAKLRDAVAGRKVYVTLSGGLDSTTIAVLAKQWLPDVTVVTFCLGKDTVDVDPESDLASATAVAESLGLPLQVVHVEPERLLELLDPVLVYGQDWREFNVHCGLVNAGIARFLSANSEGTELAPVILTGDTMNELMADYAAETFRGKIYYKLPRMSRAKLRRFLVDGLDSGDREVGIFAHYGFDTIQPFALCAQAYARYPGGGLEDEFAKQALVEEVMGDVIPTHVYERPKVRAQMADGAGEGGTLALMVEHGYDADWLIKRFCALMDSDRDEVNSFVRAGFYRFAANFPGTSRTKEV